MAMVITLAIICFLFGATIGSFLGVCSYRIPMGKYEPTREGIKPLEKSVSIASPARSFCPQCEKQLKSWHTIPLFSWLFLQGRCAYCRAPIPFRYFVIEVLTGCAAVLCLLRFGPTPTALGVFLFTCVLITITYIDLDYMIIPDVITYPATFVGLAIGLANYCFSSAISPLLNAPFVYSPFESLFGLCMGPGMLLIVWWLYFKVRKREGLGLGDVKLLAVVGAAFGPECAWFTIFCGSIIGSIVGVAILLIRRNSVSNTYIPFGPYLAFGAAAYLFELHEVVLYLVGDGNSLSWWIGGLL